MVYNKSFTMFLL